MTIQLLKSLLNPYAMNNLYKDCQASFSQEWWFDLNYPPIAYNIWELSTHQQYQTHIVSLNMWPYNSKILLRNEVNIWVLVSMNLPPSLGINTCSKNYR
jgi:hypothetical protein